MNSDEMKGKWKQLSGKVKEEWGDLTDDEIAEAGGDRLNPPERVSADPIVDLELMHRLG